MPSTIYHEMVRVNSAKTDRQEVGFPVLKKAELNYSILEMIDEFG